MIFRATALDGAFVIDLEPRVDLRGWFARTFSEDELAERGLETRFVQSSLSHNAKRATIRGLHYQAAPHEETKIVTCTRGAIYDVIVDLRPESPTFRRWVAHVLTESSHRSVYVPKGFAHGFQSLIDDTLVAYQISASYRPELQRGLRYDDPVLGIAWPLGDPIVSERDQKLPDLSLSPP